MKVKWLSLLLGVFLLGLENTPASTFLKFDSSYLGDGWFQYHMQVMNDPFFIVADITGLEINFTNQIDQSTTSTNWTNTISNNYGSAWAFSQDIPARPYDVFFMIRSDEASYRLGTNSNSDGATILLSLLLSGDNPFSGGTVYSENIVGYADFPCLVPCSLEQSDGSPTNFSYTLKLLPDISIQHLIQSDGVVQGVDFLWDYESTFLLQASADLNTWTNIAYIWSDPPETMWTTNLPLNGFGTFYRVQLAADGHATTDLPPLNSNASMVKPSAVGKSFAASREVPRVSGCQMANGEIAVNLVTEPNQQYAVSAFDYHKVVQATQLLTAPGSSATVYFDVKSLPTPVFFQVVPADAP